MEVPNIINVVETKVRLVPNRVDVEIESVKLRQVEKIVNKIVKLTGEMGDEDEWEMKGEDERRR